MNSAARIKALRIVALSDPEPTYSGRDYGPRRIPTNAAFALDKAGLLTRAPDSLSGSYRWLLTDAGRSVLEAAEAAARLPMEALPAPKRTLQRKAPIRSQKPPQREGEAKPQPKPKRKRAGLKYTKADVVWRTFIRERAGWRCEWPGCGKHYPPPTQALHAAHVFGRGKHPTRTHPLAGVALCYGHHRYADSNGEGHRIFHDWVRERIGAELFEDLARLSRMTTAAARKSDLAHLLAECLTASGAPEKPPASPPSPSARSTTGPVLASSCPLPSPAPKGNGSMVQSPTEALQGPATPVAGTGWRSS